MRQWGCDAWPPLRGAGAVVAVDPATPLWAWCRPMIRLAPVLLMMAAVASGAAADPACLPNCDGENLIGRDLRFANMPDASLRFASLVIANLARADLKRRRPIFR